MEDIFVKGLQKTHVIMGYGERRLRLNLADGPLGLIACRADGQHGHVVSFVYLATRTHRYRFQHAPPFTVFGAATRIAQHHCAHAGQLSRVHKTAKLTLVHGRGYRQVGYGPQGSHVESAMVCRPVLAHQSTTVQAHHHG